MKFTTIIVFLIPVVVARHHHRTLLETILKSKVNLFTKVADDVQQVTNTIFDLLNLEKNFITKSRTNSLLTMHYDLKSISAKNFDVYETMKDVAKPDTGNKTTNNIGLFKLIEAILDGNLSGTQNKKINSRKHTKHKPHINNIEPKFADSKEFMQFVRDFIKKVDNLSEKDFTKRPPPALPTEEKEESYTETNLMVWHPPPFLLLDHINNTDTRRIFEGIKSNIKSYPFMVSVHIMGKFTCAGSLISKDFVISAASCLQVFYNNRFFRENPRSAFVRLGSSYFAIGGNKIEIIQTHFNPMYDPKTLANNLVLLRLQKPSTFRKRSQKIKRILIDRTKHHLSANTASITVLGWGSRKHNQFDQFQRLLIARLDIYDNRDCTEIYSKNYVTNKHFCAGFMASGGGACTNDLGGPGIIGGKLVGVISFGAPVCGSIDTPTVFTKVGHYAEWIDEILNKPTLDIAESTTLQPIYNWFNIHKTYSIRELITPVTTYPQIETYTEEHVERQRQAENPGDNIPLTTILRELVLSNSSLLHDILYGSLEDDFNEIFAPATPFDLMQHPFVNISPVVPYQNYDWSSTGATPYLYRPPTSSTKLNQDPFAVYYNQPPPPPP